MAEFDLADLKPMPHEEFGHHIHSITDVALLALVEAVEANKNMLDLLTEKSDVFRREYLLDPELHAVIVTARECSARFDFGEADRG